MTHPIVQILLAFVLILFLSGLKSRFVFELQAISLLLTRSRKPGIVLYAVLMLPGTILHELSHWIVAEILRVPTGPISVLPTAETISSHHGRLGSVMTAKSDPLRGSLIGLAPLLTGLFALVVLSYFFSTLWTEGPVWIVALLVYALFVVGNSMLVSESDTRFWGISGVFLAALYYSLHKLAIPIPQSFFKFISDTFISINLALTLTFGVELTVIAAIFTLRKLTESLRGKRIIRA